MIWKKDLCLKKVIINNSHLVKLKARFDWTFFKIQNEKKIFNIVINTNYIKNVLMCMLWVLIVKWRWYVIINIIQLLTLFLTLFISILIYVELVTQRKYRTVYKTINDVSNFADVTNFYKMLNLHGLIHDSRALHGQNDTSNTNKIRKTWTTDQQ